MVCVKHFCNIATASWWGVYFIKMMLVGILHKDDGSIIDNAILRRNLFLMYFCILFFSFFFFFWRSKLIICLCGPVEHEIMEKLDI